MAVFHLFICRIPIKTGKILTWVLVLFMTCNVAVSCVALVRYDERGKGVAAEQTWQKWADTYYGDDVMKRIYPKAKEMQK